MNNYQTRDVVLGVLGYDSYGEYLASELWSVIRAETLRMNPWCWKCGESAEQVHHRRYDIPTLMGLDPCGVIPVCRECHYEAEFASGRKRTLRQANECLNCGEYIVCDQCDVRQHSERFVDRNGHLWGSCRKCMDEVDEAIQWCNERRATAR